MLFVICCFFFFKINFFEKFFREYHQGKNSLDPDQARHIVRPDLGPSCLQKLSADDTSRKRVNKIAHREIRTFDGQLSCCHVMNPFSRFPPNYCPIPPQVTSSRWTNVIIGCHSTYTSSISILLPFIHFITLRLHLHITTWGANTTLWNFIKHRMKDFCVVPFENLLKDLWSNVEFLLPWQQKGKQKSLLVKTSGKIGKIIGWKWSLVNSLSRLFICLIRWKYDTQGKGRVFLSINKGKSRQKLLDQFGNNFTQKVLV